MANLIEMTGVVSTGAISLSGVSGAQQVTATGVVTQRGPQGIQGIQGPQGVAGTPGPSDHTLLSNIGVNTHAQIDTALARLANTSGTNTGDQDLSGYATTSAMTTALALKAPLASPTFTGTPAAPTAAAGTNTTQIATTAYVKTAVDNLVASAPGALDTLDELAAALGDDQNFAATTATALAGKVALTGDQTVAGVKTFSSAPLIPDEAYGSAWNGKLEPPTKNAVYDKIEAMNSASEALAIAYAVAL